MAQNINQTFKSCFKYKEGFSSHRLWSRSYLINSPPQHDGILYYMHKICNKEENFFATLTDNRLILSVSAEAKKLLLFCSSAKVKFLFCFVEPFVLKVVFELEELYCFFFCQSFTSEKYGAEVGITNFPVHLPMLPFVQGCLIQLDKLVSLKIPQNPGSKSMRKPLLWMSEEEVLTFVMTIIRVFHWNATVSPFSISMLSVVHFSPQNV